MKVRTRLLLFGAVLPSAAMIVAVLLAGLAFRWSLLRSLDRALLAHAAVESVSLFDGPGGRPHVHLPKSPLAGEVRSFAPITALFEASGKLVASFPETRDPPVFHAHEVSREPHVHWHQEPGGPELREVLVAVNAPDGTPYVLQVASSVADIDAATRAYYAVTLAFCLIAALGLAAIQARQAARLSRRVTDMAEALPHIRGGDVEWRLSPDPTGDEVADLRVALSEAMARLRAARDAQERLIANAAHELRTPLGVMRTELDLGLRRTRSAEELRAALSAARDEVDRLGVLAARLLDLASFGRVDLSLSEGDVAEIAREAAAACEAVAAERSVRVEVSAEGPVRARFDRAALRQALDNLLSNALRFAPEGSSVRIGVARTDGRPTITVSDKGPGVPPEEAGRIFEPFHRADRRGGAGLGLAIVAEIARRHGGRAYLAPSEEGASFVVELAA